MMDEDKIQEKVREMRALIRIGRERIAKHSPVWAVYLASETLRALGDALDDLDVEMRTAPEPAKETRVRRAV